MALATGEAFSHGARLQADYALAKKNEPYPCLPANKDMVERAIPAKQKGRHTASFLFGWQLQTSVEPSCKIVLKPCSIRNCETFIESENLQFL